MLVWGVKVCSIIAGLHLEILLRGAKIEHWKTLGGDNPSWCTCVPTYEFQEGGGGGGQNPAQRGKIPLNEALHCTNLLCSSCVLHMLHVLHYKFLVQLVSCNWQEVTFQMKAELRSAWTMCGVLCVKTSGEMLMLLWCVDSWDIQVKVSIAIHLRMKCNYMVM